MPDWKIAFSWKDKRKMDVAADARIATLLWTGALAVAGIVALGLLAAGLLRRQMAVAQLKNDLVANVTHELKTPLSSMRLLVDTLLNSPALEEKTAREYLQLIARENLRLSHLIDNFLAFSRIEREQIRLRLPPRAGAPNCGQRRRRRARTLQRPRLPLHRRRPAGFAARPGRRRRDGHGPAQSPGQRLEVFRRAKNK